MRRACFLFALIAGSDAVAAPAQSRPDFYTCVAQAFSNMGGMHAVGVGEVSLTFDTAGRPISGTFRYAVRDRAAGFTRLVATWSLVNDRQVSLGPIQSIRIPFHRQIREPLAKIALHMGEQTPPAAPVPLSTTRWIELHPDGGAFAITMRVDDGAIPELRDHRSFGYVLTGGDGSQILADFFLMPDWRRVASAIRSATRRARGLMRRGRCNPTYIIGAAQP